LLVLEAAENNREALKYCRKRNFIKLDADVFWLESSVQLVTCSAKGNKAVQGQVNYRE
jgi:hypothetical protein